MSFATEMGGRDRLVVNLGGIPDQQLDAAIELWAPYIGFFLVGMGLIIRVGLERLAHAIAGHHGRLIVDGQFVQDAYEMGNTAQALRGHGVGMFSLSSQADAETITAAIVNSDNAIVLIDLNHAPSSKLVQEANIALRLGCGGLICNSSQLGRLAASPTLTSFPKIVRVIIRAGNTRPTPAPAQAIRDGADMIVIRPLISVQAMIPVLQEIVQDIGVGLADRRSR